MLLRHIKGVPAWMSASIIISCNAMVFGLDTGTIGPVTTMSSFIQSFGDFSATLHGVIVSSILLTGASTSLIAGILADRYGRTRIIALGSLIFGIGGALETAATSLPMFIVGRLIKGVGEGMFLMTVYVLVAEISPAKRRGTVANFPQIFISTGIVAGFFICYGTERLLGSLAWRLPLAIQTGIALANAAACLLIPESPRWLLAKRETERARQVIAQLDIVSDEQEELFRDSVAGLEHSPDLSLLESIRETLHGFREAFAAPTRGRTIFGCFILASQQLSGIDGVLYYAPVLFKQAGLDAASAAFFASGISALVMMIVTIPGTLMCDMWGRKTSSLIGGCLISFFMLLIGSLYAAGDVKADSGAARWVVIVSIYLFACTFSVTWALGLRIYLIESLPRKTRSSGASLAQASNWFANYLVALTTPIFLASSSFGAYYFFTFCSLFCTLMCAFFMIETKGHSLEYIEQRFAEKHLSASSVNGWWRPRGHAISLRHTTSSRPGLT